MSAAWWLLLAAGGVVAGVVWWLAVERPRPRAGADITGDASSGAGALAYDVPLSYAEARKIIAQLAYLAALAEHVAQRLPQDGDLRLARDVATAARLMAQTLKARHDAPRPVDDA